MFELKSDWAIAAFAVLTMLEGSRIRSEVSIVEAMTKADAGSMRFALL